MPSTKFVNVKIKSLPCCEQEGMIWIWPGNEPSEPIIPSLLPPQGFQIHAEMVMELPVEHRLLLDNLHATEFRVLYSPIIPHLQRVGVFQGIGSIIMA